jgi:biopolymer transport protein TolR
MAASGGDIDGTSISGINVTPLVDVMLVLLVIFMVAAPIIQQGVNVELPRTSGAALEGEDVALVVSVTRDGKVYLNDNVIAREALTEKLVAVMKEKPQQVVYLRADDQAAYGSVVKVISTIKGAGIEKLGMITEPEPEAG